MFDYVPDVFRKQYAETEEEADRWYTDPDNNRRPPELLPRDEVARAINSEVKAGRGTPAGGVYLDIASRRPAEFILKRLPSMYHQFKELADVDITKQPMEIGPTCHYVMGGVEVDPDTRRRGRHGAGPVRGRRGLRRHARLQPARRQLAVRPAGLRQAGRRVRGRVRRRRSAATGRRSPRPTSTRPLETALAPLNRGDEGENPYHGLARPAGGHAGPGRHHPPQGRAGRVASSSSPSCATGWRTSARPAAASSTRAGTSPSTCATCWSSRSARPRPRWSARSRAAVTPARTSRRWTDKWRQVNLVCSLNPSGDGVDLHAPAAADAAAGAARPVRAVGAVEVHDRSGAGRLRRGGARPRSR